MKTSLNHLLFLLIIPLALTGQPAPDFTITTTHNETVSLYEDYLDQGQTVVLEVMFTTCPPCNSIAEDVETLYQEWGGGSGDVEFFSLSNKSFDSNADVADYEESHGLTFPGAGEDGGSLDAVAPYQSGQWGPFFGTPTFVVISPDGSVQFDVGSGNNQQIIEDLNAAIEATGAQRPGGDDDYIPDTLDFKVRVFKADQSSPMQGVTVHLIDTTEADGMLQSGTTGSDGRVTFPDVVVDTNRVYAAAAALDGEPLAGVTTYDIVLIQRIILGLSSTGNPFEEKAMDVSEDDRITALDILDIRKVLLGILNNYRGEAAWVFAGTTTGEGLAEPPLVFPDADGSGQTEVTLYGIKLGDISGDVNPF